MEYDTKLAAEYAGQKLDTLLERATRDSGEAIGSNDIPVAVTHYVNLKDIIDGLAAKMAELQKHMQTLSYELLPTMLQNANVKTINVEDVGRVSVIDRWSASMLDKTRAFEWLRATGNDGLIIETVNASTLGAFARTESEAGKPLPRDIFKAGATPHISITKA